MCIFTCTDFIGYWPVGTAAVVRADSRDVAEKMLRERLRDLGLPQKEHGLTLELFSKDMRIKILCDGDY